MSRENVDIVRRCYEAWNRGDWDGVIAFADPDIEWYTPKEDPDWGSYSGHDGLRRFWTDWAEAVGRLRFEPEEFIDTEDHVVVVTRRRGRGIQSGLEIEDRVIQVVTMRDGKGTCVREFYDRAEALEAVGLTE
jgi:uncharacterized protein